MSYLEPQFAKAAVLEKQQLNRLELEAVKQERSRFELELEAEIKLMREFALLLLLKFQSLFQ